MAAKKSYYQILGVAESATPEEIKKSYRKLAKRYHPDVTGGDKAKEAKFKELSEANETLSDEKKRAQYDAERKNPFASGGGRGGAGGPFPGGFPGDGGGRVHVDLNDLFSGAGRGGAAPGGGFGDLFSELFGQRARAEARPVDFGRGADVHARMEVELPVAAIGGDQAIVVDGKRWNVKIPAGIEEGQVIRLTGKGAPGHGNAAAGDLLLEVHVKAHPHFRPSASSPDDLEVDLPLAIEEAVIGGKVEARTLEGKVQLTVPPSTSSGIRMRLRGKGRKRRDGTRGDLYAVTQIVLPKEMPEAARKLLEDFAKALKPRPA